MDNFNEILFFVVSIIATFISSNSSFKPLHKSLIIAGCLTLAFLILLWKNNGIVDLTILFSGLLFLTLTICIYYFTAKSDLRSRKKINQEIINFTKLADTKQEIRLFGGDLNFFGNVIDNSILNNEQFLQLKEMDFHKIRVLCIQPNNEEDKLRLGFLQHEFGNKIQIKFFNDLECKNCTLTIQKENKCNKRTINEEENKKYMSDNANNLPYRNNPCYCPDPSIRGRIITKSNNNANSLSVVIKFKAGEKYIFKQYNSEDKECNLYLLLWSVWWGKCKEDKNILKVCMNEYKALLRV